MKRPIAVLALVLALLVPASLAPAASLPKPPDSRIVVPTSIGGIKVNMPEGKAKKAWGNRGKCSDYGFSGRCEYGSYEGPGGYATVEFLHGKVSSVQVLAGKTASGSQKATAAAALTGLRTADGIGLGSKFSALKRALPKGKLTGSTKSEIFFWTIQGSGKKSMTFSVLSASKKVFQIVLSNGLEG